MPYNLLLLTQSTARIFLAYNVAVAIHKVGHKKDHFEKFASRGYNDAETVVILSQLNIICTIPVKQ